MAGAARRRVRSLGVRGLDLGCGCGVMLGYGWGAGVYLKPTALQSLGAALQAAGQQAAARLPEPLQAALRQRQSPAPPLSELGGAGGSGTWQSPALPLQHTEGSTAAAATAAQPHLQLGTHGDSGGSAASGGTAERQRRQLEQQERELGELARLVLKQQNELGDLRGQLAGLQAAVCKLDPAAHGCKR